MIHCFSQNALKNFPLSFLFRSCFGVAFFELAQIVESIDLHVFLWTWEVFRLFVQILFMFHSGSPPLLGCPILDLFCHFCPGHWGSVHFFPQSLLSLLFRLGKCYWFVFKFTSSMLCQLNSTIEHIQQVLKSLLFIFHIIYICFIYDSFYFLIALSGFFSHLSQDNLWLCIKTFLWWLL